MPSKTLAENTEEVTLEQVQQAAAMAVNTYFTPEVNARITELTNDQMVMGLQALEQTSSWIPILRYVNQRLLMAQSTINSLDPNTQATAMARTQGIMTGLTDIQNVVISLVATAKGMAEETERLRSEGV